MSDSPSSGYAAPVSASPGPTGLAPADVAAIEQLTGRHLGNPHFRHQIFKMA